mgnify:CR=1 FL=1|jgi:uncharacterized spore protein YtfJ
MDQNLVRENVDTLFHSLENFTQKEGILGKPITEGDKVFVPVLSVTVGYGSGNTAGKNQQMASTESSGGALGLGAKLSTDAVIMVDNGNNGSVSLLPLNASGNVSQLIDKIPQIVSGMNTKQNQSQ